jgi:hypothetical protein
MNIGAGHSCSGCRDAPGSDPEAPPLIETPLKARPRSYGCDLTPNEFRELLADLKDAMFPAYTDEDLGYTRDEADGYCQAVRARAHCQNLPRVSILRSLDGIRKHEIKA